MISMLKRATRALVRMTGYDIVPALSRTPSDPYPDIDAATLEMYRSVRPFTMTSRERILALRSSVQYVVKHDIPGDIVECGVWKGGSMMAVALTLRQCDVEHRRLHLFDTFEGMPPPGPNDVEFRGESASNILAREEKLTSTVWAISPLDEVKRNLKSTGYPESKLVFVKGLVEVTLPAYAPDRISILRLDTDWYESTYHELVHLYPRLSVGGVLIIDDYGHWAGARRAVDQYVSENRVRLLLNRIDYTGRICVKTEP